MCNSVALSDNNSNVALENTFTNEFNWIQVFWVFVGAAIFISGALAFYCMMKGGNVAWSTRYGVWVQVACNFR